MKTQAFVVVAWVSACCGLSFAAIRSNSNQQPESPPASVDEQPAAPRKVVSAGIADVLKMAQRGVDSSVLKSFVENYPVAYNPNADEIIALHDAGISSDIIASLLRRSGELKARQQVEASNGGVAQRSEVRKQIVAETPQYPVQTVVTQPAPQVTYVQPSYVYPNYYPTYYPTYSYGYGVPFYYSSGYCYRPYNYYSSGYCYRPYNYYGYGSRSYCRSSWPSWPSYGVSVGYRSSFGAHAHSGYGSRSVAQHSGHFVRR